jgi:hypothetical protein
VPNALCSINPRPTPPHRSLPAVIWDALKAACEADLETARAILDSAGVIVASADMTICYDERGRKYELPRYVITPPSNLVRAAPQDGSKRGAGLRSGSNGGGGGQLELPAVAAAGGGSGSPPSAASHESAAMADDAPLNQVAVR